MSLVRTAITVLARLTCIGFLVSAGLAIPEAWSLNKEEDYVRSGSTLYVPLLICEPQSISYSQSNNTVTFGDDDDIGKCRSLEYLINACVASILFAMAALLIFFLFDTLARCKRGPVGSSSVLGMSLFLTFILVQAAACCFALYKEMDFWENYFQNAFDAIEDSEITEVETHGNKTTLYITFILALVSAGALLFDTLLIFCCGTGSSERKRRKSKRQDERPQNEQPTASAPSSDDLNRTAEEESFDASPQDDQLVSSSRPAWTNV